MLARDYTPYMRVMALCLLLLALSGCVRNEREPVPQGEPAPLHGRQEVPWADYDSSLKPRIDALEAVADCAALQSEFDAADANNQVVLGNTGHNNAALMGYIDEALGLAGCYD